MIRISALNESFSDGNSKSQSRTTTKEAKEAEAFALYNKALGLQRQGETTRAEALFKELLHHPFMQEAVRLVNEDGQEAIHPGLQVLYSTHKNMATIALQRDDTTAAIESLLEALVVDGTEVTVWYRVGTLAMKLSKYSLARFSFEQGLQCNPRHWPCLDSVITVLYVLNDYWHCLSYIATALERDSGYSKGLMIRRQIYREHAALKKDTEEFFRLCDPAIFLMEVDQKETDEFVAEALAMRQKRRELAKVKPPTPVKLPTLADYSWRSLGRSLVALYDYITQSNPPKSLALRIDVSAYGPEAQKSEKDSERPSVAAPESEKVSTNPTQPQPETPMDVETPSPEGNQNIPPNLAVDKPVEVGDLDTCQNPPTTAVREPPPPVSVTSSLATPTAGVPAADPTPSTEQLSGKDSEKAAEDGQPELPMETDEGAGTGVPAEVALHDHCAAMDPNDLGAGSRKGAKRKRLQLEGATKRRSARVRNTNKKKEDETVNFQDLLQKFLPSSLLQVDETEEEDGEFGTGQSADDTTTKIDTHTVTGEEPQSDLPLITATEESDVREFLLQQQKNGGLILMMKKYLYFLSERDNMKWSENLKSTYMEVYGRARHHIRYPDCPDSDEPDPGVKSSAKMCLVYNELKLDQWLSRKVKFSPSPGPPTGSPRKSSPSSLLLSADFPGKQFTDDMWFLCTILGYSQILEEFWAEHAARVYWLKGRFSILTNQLQDAVDFLNMAQFYAKLAAEEDQKPQIRLCQCQVDNVISQEHVAKQLESLERCTALEEIQQCYDNKEYQRVVDCLLPTFRQPLAKQQRREGANIPERQSQLLLLQDSLFKLKDLKKCLLWGEEILSEAVQHYRHAFGSTREEWGATLTQIFAGINKCISQEEDVIGSLPASSLVRLTQNLVRIIELLMDTPDFVTEVPVDTVLPWIVLYKLISHEEKKLHSLSVADGEECLDGAVTSSFMLLNVAHEYLGRRSWCTQSDGMLLKFFLGVLRAELEKSVEGKSALYEEEINQAFEQCSYCLFGYPNKKSRVKHLQDHGCQQIPLTWNKAVDLFEYFKPKTVPEFDSYKTSTVSGELQGLLRRISSLVPEKYRAGSTVDQVQAYVEGSTTGPPMALAEKCGDAPVVRELYYLLADYYFKNKEQAKAIKFYMLDLCYNPWRVDSWAGLALARMSKLQQKLSSHELKMDMPILKQSISPLRCFRRAVETDDTNSKLWIEYGCLAYELHSHASRQIKLNTHFPVAEDMLKLSRTTRTDMLKIAGNCYRMANQCESDGNEEEWLHHYMMGKVAEKQRKPASEYLKHYRLAAMHTHEDNAVYPRKITYVVSPPHLACEALEVFYRLHAASLKLLLKHSTEVDYGVVEGYLTEAAQTPFALSREKRRESSRESQSSGSDAELLMGQPGTPIRKRHNYHTNPQDHNYSRQKSRESGSATEGSVSGAESVDPLTSAVSATLQSMVTKVARNLDGESSEAKERGLLKNNDNKSQVPGQKPKASFLMADILANTGRNKKGESVPEINKGDNPSQQFKGDNPKEIYIKIDSDSCDEYSSATSSRISATTSESDIKEKKTISSTESAPVLKNESESEKKDGWKTIPIKTEIESGDKNKQQAMGTDGANNKNVVSSDLKKPVDGQNSGTTKDEKKDYGPPGFKNPKHKELMDKCVAGLSLCLSRFPQHYKSLYRLSHLYLHSPLHKNLEFARDLLLGNPNWQQLRHMPAPGLFADRKSTDFFKGVWRIPIDEIDRSGSFRSHLARSVQLVLDVLREQKDASTLFHVHHQLSRVPDLGKKYMRDAERVFFARQAFVFSLDAMETQLGEVNKVPARDRDPLVHLSFLIEVYRLWNYGVNKMSGLVDRVNDLFAKAFRIICADRVDKTRPVLEQALLFCQEQLALARVQVQTVGSPRSSGMSPRALFSSPSYDRAQDYPTIYHREHKGEISTKAVATPVTAHQPTTTTTPNKSESKLKAVSGLQKPDTNVLDLSVAKNPTSDTKKSSSNVASAAPVSKMPLVTSFIKAAVADSGKKSMEIPVKKQPTVSTVVKQQPASGVGGVSLLRKNQLVSSTKSASQVVTPRTEHPVVFSSAANKPVPSLAALREEAGKKANCGNKNLLERLVKLPNADSSSAKALSSSQQNIPTQTKQLPKPPIQNPQSLSLSGKKLPLPVAKPVQQPPLTNVTPQITDQSEPACIILSDSEESSHSSLMEFTIELNDSDFDEPIIITTSDWNS